MLRITTRVGNRDRRELKAKCPKHPGYDPAREGLSGIKGGCIYCQLSFELYQKFARFLEDLASEFWKFSDLVVSSGVRANGDRRSSGNALRSARK